MGKWTGLGVNGWIGEQERAWMPRRMSSRWGLLDDQALGQKRTWPTVGQAIG